MIRKYGNQNFLFYQITEQNFDLKIEGRYKLGDHKY